MMEAAGKLPRDRAGIGRKIKIIRRLLFTGTRRVAIAPSNIWYHEDAGDEWRASILASRRNGVESTLPAIGMSHISACVPVR